MPPHTTPQSKMSTKPQYSCGTTIVSTVPPPVPKRKFEKLIAPPSQPASPNVIQFSPTTMSAEVPPHRNISKRSCRKNRRSPQKTTYPTDQQSSDDDLLCLEPSLMVTTTFGDDDEDESNDLPVFESAASIQFPNSNRSSSDSNKSQLTNDTGYMTSASNDNDRIFFGGGSADHNYRSRFSSVDTQSSIDSFSDVTTKQINSPLSAGMRGVRRSAVPPVVPVRKQTSVPKIPPPIGGNSSGGNLNRSRGVPPIPPIRTQNSLDSAKMLQNGYLFGANGFVPPPGTKHFGQEMYSKPMMKGGTATAYSSKMHHSKLTQRQDSSISSDSYSMTSSPGYNTKSMEAPLLQYAAKINKSGIRHQDSNDSFGIMTNVRIGYMGGASSVGNGTAVGIYSGGNNGAGCGVSAGAIRQDSNVSSDSFSQTSSPGYNTKLIDAPLIAHAVKLHSSKILPLFANT